MDDLEICKRIAEIDQGTDFRVNFQRGDVFQPQIFVNLHYWEDYNPLSDNELCFDLMVKFKVMISWQPVNGRWAAVIGSENEEFPFSCTIANSSDESPNKAVCLAIIEAHKD